MLGTNTGSAAPAGSAPVSRERFTPFAQVVHWSTALLMIIVVVIAWHMKMYPKSDFSREGWYYTHESIGITILAMTIVRLVWRRFHAPPPLPGRINALEQGLATASHWALYGVLLIMPLSGYCLAAGTGHSLPFFFVFTVPPLLPKSPALAAVGQAIHAVGQWFLYVLFGLHLLATVWHVWVRRDGVLNRMLPPQEETSGG